jgi:hypothetical protein
MMYRVGLALAMLALGALGGCGGGSVPSGDPVASPSPSPSPSPSSIPAETFRLDGTTVSFPLTLEVSGDATADITYATGRDQPPTQIRADTPWTKTLQLSSGAGLMPTLTARTSNTTANATITCRIKIAGTLVDAKTARGPHALATCSTLSPVG